MYEIQQYCRMHGFDLNWMFLRSFEVVLFCLLLIIIIVFFFFFFFFQAEDGIRDKLVTGVQTCALPISSPFVWFGNRRPSRWLSQPRPCRRSATGKSSSSSTAIGSKRDRWNWVAPKIGRASCRERV